MILVRHLRPRVGTIVVANCVDRLEIAPPVEVADRLDRLFPFATSTEQFATIIYGVLNFMTGEFRSVSAGHPGPVHLPAGACPAILESEGSPRGPAEGPHEERSDWRRGTGCTSTPMASPRRWTAPASGSVMTGRWR